MNDIERLLAIEGIKTTKARYFRCLDTKDLAGYASVFAPDAVMDMRGESRDGEGLVSGAGNIASFVLGSVSGLSTVHHGHMPEIEFSSDTSASVIWAMEDKLWKVDDAAAVVPFSTLHGYGHYHETYVRIEDQWLIRTITLMRLRVDIS
jgi:hypothetical protein